jgi:hypothetical protein
MSGAHQTSRKFQRAHRYLYFTMSFHPLTLTHCFTGRSSGGKDSTPSSDEDGYHSAVSDGEESADPDQAFAHYTIPQRAEWTLAVADATAPVEHDIVAG